MASGIRLRSLAILAAPTLLLAGLGAVVAAVDGERGLTSRPGLTGSRAEPAAAATQPTSPPSAGVPIGEAGFEAQLRQLRTEVQALRVAVAELKQTAELRLTPAKVAMFEAAPAKTPASFDIGRLVSAALLLREATQSAAPFARELDAVAALAADSVPSNVTLERAALIDRIGQLQAYAETGMATRRDLRRSFPTVAAAIDRAQALPWWQSLMVLIGWREDPLAPVQEAEAALQYDDLSGAVESLAALSGEPAAAAEGWLTLARTRIAIDAATARLYRLILEAGGSRAAPRDTLALVRAAAASRELE